MHSLYRFHEDDFDTDYDDFEFVLSVQYRLLRDDMFPPSERVRIIKEHKKEIKEAAKRFIDDALARITKARTAKQVFKANVYALDSEINLIDGHIEFIKKCVVIILAYTTRQSITDGKITRAFDIKQLKLIPITNFIDFRHNQAKCIWHDDKNPSMHYYIKSNTVHCFSCQKNGDVIDVIQQLHHFDLISALNFLSTT
jgi:hypothetical protein